MAKSQTKKDKERFFADLEQLDDSTTETEDELEVLTNESKNHARRAARAGSNAPRTRTLDRNAGKLPILTSSRDPIIIDDTPEAETMKIAAPVKTPSSPMRRRPEVTSRPEVLTDARPAAKRPRTNASAARRTKKQKVELELVPEEKRIFGGLSFFFIPNDDIAKPRKTRIRMSREYGARWVTKFNNEVTHVIVEPHISYSEAAKAFPDRLIPEGTILVRTSWLAESISSLYVRDVHQGRFRLRGAPEVHVPEPSSRSTLPSGTDVNGGEKSSLTAARPVKPVSTDSNRELDGIIAQVKTAASLPLDIGSDDNGSFSSAVPESSFNSTSLPESTKQAQSRPRQNKEFLCMDPGSSSEGGNPNFKTIAILQEMATHYDRTGDHWRTTAYRKAVAALRKQKELVSSYEQAVAIPQIGTRLADKVVEIVATNRLRRLESAKNDPEAKVLKLFMGIYDVGFKQASLWMAQGHRSLSDLTEHAKLTANQKVGIAHYEDFQSRIPRSEVSQHAEVVRRACFAVDANIQVIVGGSYRRGSPDSGDIDVLITKPGADMANIRTLMNGSVVPSLFASGFMKCALASSSSLSFSETPEVSQFPAPSRTGSGSSSGSKFHGASCLSTSTTWRRIDLLFVPWNELGAALIYFTGNDIFNRSMRLLASKKGMRLNQHGLYKDVMRGPGRVKMTEGALIEGRDERKIFEVLGVPWREPEERIC